MSLVLRSVQAREGNRVTWQQGRRFAFDIVGSRDINPTPQNSAFEQSIANSSTYNKTYLQSLIQKRQIVKTYNFFLNSFCAQLAFYSPRFTKLSSKCIVQIRTFGLCCSVVSLTWLHKFCSYWNHAFFLYLNIWAALCKYFHIVT